MLIVLAKLAAKVAHAAVPVFTNSVVQPMHK